MTASPRRLIILAAPARSGSTRLWHLLSAFHNVHSLGEYFNFSAQKDDNAKVLRPLFGSEPDNPLFTQFRDRKACWESPINAIRVAADRTSKNLTVKISPRRPTGNTLEPLMRSVPTSVLVLKRRPIDSFISLQKANSLGVWGNVDTSALTVTLSVKHYLNYLQELSRFYAQVERAAQQALVPTRQLTYEDHINIPDTVLLKYLATSLRMLDVSAGKLGASDYTLREKQDTVTDYTQKVANWGPFLEELADYDLRLLSQLPKVNND